MRVKCTSSNRELILQVLERETGKAREYHGLPEFSYHVGGYWLMRSGYIEFDAAADAIHMLASLGLCEHPNDMSEVCISSALAHQHAPRAEHAPRELSYPLAEHSGQTLVNLFSIISARQILLNRALDAKGAFFVSRELMEDLLAHPPGTIDEFMQAIYRREDDYQGIVFAGDRIILSGFARGHSAESDIHRQLADLIMQAALNHLWIKPFTRNVRNKKYYFRVWLIYLGMVGPEYERARQVLLDRLPGRSGQRVIPRGKSFSAGARAGTSNSPTDSGARVGANNLPAVSGARPESGSIPAFAADQRKEG